MSGRHPPASAAASYAQLALGMAVFGSGTPISKLVTDAFPVFIACGLRMALAAVILLPFLVSQRWQLTQFARRDWLIVAAIALVGMFGFSIFMLYGMRYISGVVGSVVMSTTPAVTALGAVVFLHERLGWRKALAVGLAVAGVLILHLGNGRDSGSADNGMIFGTLLIFAAVCSEASYTLLGKRASESASPVVVAALAAFIATLMFLPFAVYQSGDFDPGGVAFADWLALIWWGVGTMALGSVLWYRGVASVPGSTAAGFMGVMPVSALVLSYVLLGEAFVWTHLAGFAVVFASVLLVANEHTRMADNSNASRVC